LAGPFEPGLKLRGKLFAVTPDARYLVYGGAWDFSLRIFSLGEKGGKSEKNFGFGIAFYLAKNSEFLWRRGKHAVCCGSGMFIPGSRSEFFPSRISDPGSKRFPDPGSGSASPSKN
jgi:hypothetical protein